MSKIIEKLPQVVANCIGAANFGDGTYRVDFAGSSRNATAPEIASAQALVDADASTAVQLDTLRTQAITAIARLQQIQAAAAPTNAQVIAAIRDMATYQEKVIRVVFSTLG